MSDATTIFRFENVSFGYSTSGQNLVLVDNFSGDIKQGEFSIIIGRNGTGKSTVLKTMSRLIPALSGNIYLNNKLLNSYSSKEFPKTISFVTTDLPRNPVMTVIEMVSLGRFPYTNWTGALNKTDRSEVEKALELTGLKSHENKPLYMISDGERQRAMIARTLAQNTPVIILDEPTAFLDLPNKYELVSLLAELTVSSGKTILLSTHDTGIAFRFPDKLLIMNEKTITSGAPEDMFLNGPDGNWFQENGKVELGRVLGPGFDCQSRCIYSAGSYFHPINDRDH